MAKKKVKSACSTECGPHCLFAGVFGSVALAVGLFLLVGGIMIQVESANLWNSCLWYLGGFLLMGLGKHIMKKACPSCR